MSKGGNNEATIFQKKLKMFFEEIQNEFLKNIQI